MVEKQPSFADWRTTTRVTSTQVARTLVVAAPAASPRMSCCLTSRCSGSRHRLAANRNSTTQRDPNDLEGGPLADSLESACRPVAPELQQRTPARSRYLRPDGQTRGKGGRQPAAERAVGNRPIGWRPSSPLRDHCWVTLVLLVLLPSLSLSRPARAAVDAASVQRSIDRGIAYLRKTQNQRGGWTEFSGQSCGLSSLCTLALLNAGVPKDDPDMVRAMRYLREFEPNETYSVSLQTLVYCQLGAAGDLPRIRRNVDWLVANQKQGDPLNQRGGSWDYGSGRGSGDPSNAQFALLALGAAQDRGIEINPEVFRRALAYWLPRQRGGAWSYGSNRRMSGSMTCAGIASIIIARGCLGDTSAESEKDQIRCCGADPVGLDPIEEGLRWLGNNFTLQVNPGGDSLTFFYYLYALERVGRLSGRRFIGGHDWYREGAERLSELQDEFVGFWAGTGVMEENRDIATAFALLFLSKGKRQVVAGRLKYGDPQGPQQWQQHPDSLRQLVRHVERDWGRDLTWQTIDAETASLQDLLQAPVLIISGRDPLRLRPEFAEQLKQYVDQGGCLLFEGEGGDGCGDASGFERSVTQLCESWYEGTTLERLPPSHPVWSAEHKVDPAAIAPDFWVYGVQACCRTAIFYVPRSLSCRWELGDRLFHRNRGSEAVNRQVEAAIRIGENVIAYATGRELKEKLEQRVVLDGQPQGEPLRGDVRLAMLALGAGGEEAKRALPNASSLIAARIPMRVSASAQPVGFEPETLRDLPFLWIHGRTDFQFDPAQRKVLREYVENGGIILGSAVCGSQAFADAFRRELALVLPEAPLQVVPPGHEVLSPVNGFDIRSVTIRRPSREGGVERRQGSPMLEMALVDNLVGVFFSPLDLSCALESPNSVQCPGYATDEAAKIVANLVLYSLQQ